jgi:hypothetical protein
MRNGLFSTTAIAGLVATLAAAPKAAEAAQFMSVTITNGGQVTSSGADISATGLFIPKFNPADGTLKSVLVVENLTGTYKGNAKASSVSASVTATMSTGLKISGGPVVLDGNPALTLSAKAPVTATTAGTNFTTSSSPKARRTTYGASSAWTGTGDFEITVGPSTTAVASTPSSGYDVNAVPSLTFDIAVGYTFTTPHSSSPAPEPTSLLMLGSGVIALGAAQRRRRRRRPG